MARHRPAPTRNGARHCCRAPLRRARFCRCSVRFQANPEGCRLSPSRSLRARSGVASVSVAHPVARANSPIFVRRFLGAPSPADRLCLRLPGFPSGPKTFRSTCSRRRSHSFPSPLHPLPCGSDASSPVRSDTRPGSQILASQSHPPQATACPFAALLGMTFLRAALASILAEACPACGGEMVISSGASCRRCSGDPSLSSSWASWDARVSVSEFHSGALPAEIGDCFPTLSPSPCGAFEGEGRCPPITC